MMKHLRQKWIGYLLFDAAFRPSRGESRRRATKLGRIFFKKQTSNQLDAQLVIAICVLFSIIYYLCSIVYGLHTSAKRDIKGQRIQRQKRFGFNLPDF